MNRVDVAECVGCFSFKKKDGNVGYISHFIYDCGDEQRAVFTSWERCTVGELYNFVMVGFQAQLVDLNK